MKLSVRDLFWLALLVASVTFWWSEHRRVARLIGVWRQSFHVRHDWNYPSNAERQRLAAVHQFADLTNESLNARFALLAAADERSPEYEPCLAEMARRGMSAELQQHYDALMASDQMPTPHSLLGFPHNLELLTALRRSRNRPDPLRIDVELSGHLTYGKSDRPPTVTATITNVDVGREAVVLMQGGDYRGGRRDRWQFLLTNENGQRVADSNFLSFNGGGVFGYRPLDYSQTAKGASVDLRRYIAAPRSGRYQLQALYHNRVSIADEQDLAGLIVSKSAPIWVAVNNLDQTERWWTKGPHPALAILAAGALLTAMAVVRIGRSWKIVRRDLVWAALLAAIALGFWLDTLRQSHQLHRLVPDAHARWTIAPAGQPPQAAVD
jgi:hypothetical protein